MTLRRIALFLLLTCLLAPAAQAAGIEPYGWLPQWALDLVELIRDSLGAEIPANPGLNVGPWSVPTG